MSLDGNKRRRSIRLRDFDYSQEAAYFVTICTARRQLFFDQPALRALADDCWKEIPDHHPNVVLGEWIVMPNHVHAVLFLENRRGVQLNAPTSRNEHNARSRISPARHTLGLVVRTYKAAVTTSARRRGFDWFAWQRNYYEHVIRSEADLTRIREYLRYNPLRWDTDEYNPARQAGNPVPAESIP